MFALFKTASPCDLFEKGKKTWNEFSSREQTVIIEAYLPKVRYLAQTLKKRVPESMEYNELFNAGVLGLLDAARKYDSSCGNTFSTYAENRIKGAMLDELRSKDPLSRGTRSLVKTLNAAIDKYEVRYGRRPGETELTKLTTLSLDEVRRGLEAMEQLVSTDMSVLAENLTNESIESGGTPCDNAIRNEIVANMRVCLTMLNERERFILSMYYVEEYTMKDIATVLKVSEGRVSQLRSQAIRCLHKFYMERFGK